MQFNLKIKMDNDAFEPFPGDEVRLILEKLSSNLVFGLRVGDGAPLRDSNGGTVGSWEVAADD